MAFSSAGGRRFAVCAALLGLVAALFLPAAAGAAAPALRKVFVYAGKDRVRVVALFGGALRAGRLQPRLRNGRLAVYVPGVRGGKSHRRFAVGQGGYRHIDAREEKGGLWLYLTGARKLAGVPAGAEASVSGTAVALTLPVMRRGAAARAVSLRGAEVAAPAVSARPPRPSKYAPWSRRRAAPAKARLASPEELLRRMISPKTAEAAAFGRRAGKKGISSKAPAAAPRKLDWKKTAAPVSQKTKFALPKGKEAKTRFFPKADTPSYSKFLLGTGGVLGIIIGGFMLFRRFGAGAAGGLKGNGKLIRTLHRSYIAPKQSLALVEVAGEVLVLGISGQNISMLTKLDDAAALEQLRGGGEKSFVDHLQNFMKKAESEAGPQLPKPGEKRQRAPKGGPIASALFAYAQGKKMKKSADAPPVSQTPPVSQAPQLARHAMKPALSSGESGGGSFRLKERLQRIEGALAT